MTGECIQRVVQYPGRYSTRFGDRRSRRRGGYSNGHGRRHARQYLSSRNRSEEHTSELQSLMRISYAVFCLKKKKTKTNKQNTHAEIKMYICRDIRTKTQHKYRTKRSAHTR